MRKKRKELKAHTTIIFQADGFDAQLCEPGIPGPWTLLRPLKTCPMPYMETTKMPACSTKFNTCSMLIYFAISSSSKASLTLCLITDSVTKH